MSERIAILQILDSRDKSESEIDLLEEVNYHSAAEGFMKLVSAKAF